MFKENFNSKQQGNVGIAAAILYFTRIGWIVTLPLNDSQKYDIIVDDGSNLFRVQVKTTRFIESNSTYTVCLKSSGGTKGKIYATLSESNCDLLFILCSNGDTYLIPKTVFKKVKYGLTLSEKYIQYKI